METSGNIRSYSREFFSIYRKPSDRKYPNQFHSLHICHMDHVFPCSGVREKAFQKIGGLPQFFLMEDHPFLFLEKCQVKHTGLYQILEEMTSLSLSASR